MVALQATAKGEDRGQDVISECGKSTMNGGEMTRKVATRAVLVGALPVVLGHGVSLGWAVLLSGGRVGSAGEWWRDTAGWLLGPCVLIAWGLAAWSLRVSCGVSRSGRVLSLVLWQMLTPAVYTLGFAVWAGAENASVEDAAVSLWGVFIGLVVWCACLTPAFIIAIGNRVLADDVDNGPRVRVTTRDERDEDAETARA